MAYPNLHLNPVQRDRKWTDLPIGQEDNRGQKEAYIFVYCSSSVLI